MGFDWETMLGCEGGSIEDAYDSLVSEAGEREMRDYDRYRDDDFFEDDE